MSYTAYNIITPPTGATYRHLVVFLFKYGYSCSLVLRQDTLVTPSQQAFINRAEPFLLQKVEQTDWPGTALLNGVANIYVYRLGQGDYVSFLL